jgi:hypothetical protein
MTAFVRRFREVPTIEVLTEIEQVAIVDQVPQTTPVGVGSGTMLLVGEFEDGPFNTPTEVFGDNDELAKFGGFGFQRGTLLSQDPCARIHGGEAWNGNAFIKGKFLKPQRKICCRVDTRVGDIRFQPLASVRTAVGPFRLTVGGQITVTPDGGSPVSTTALAAVVATKSGIAFPGGSNLSEFVGGEQISITIDANPAVIVTFQAADSTAAQVAARINSFLGYAAATTILSGTAIRIIGVVAGTDGAVVLANVAGTPLTNIGLSPSTTNGTGTVGNINAVTATEVQTIVNALAGVDARVDADGRVVIFSPTTGTGSILVASTTMATEVGIAAADLGVTLDALVGEATIIPAGTRVSNSGDTMRWLSMQTLRIPEGTDDTPNLSFYSSPIRPVLDDGTGTSATAGQVSALIDIPGGRMFSVTNISNVSAALSEVQIDVAYEAAFDATVNPSKISRVVNSSLCARNSDAVMRKGRDNAILASNEGNFGRKFHGRAPLGYTLDQAIANVALYRSDRVFFTYPGWRVRIPEIAVVGLAGGTGFTEDGVITIGADGPLCYINCQIPPEENPGQDTGLLTFVLGIEDIDGVTEIFDVNTYKAFKREGICAPRVDQAGTPVYQSEVTSSLEDGRTTQKRRKMADFIQDSIGILLLPYSKKLNTENREAAIDSKLTSFLANLRAANQPERQRIAGYLMTNTTAQNPDLADRGISTRKVVVKLLSSNDTFLVNTTIGESAVTVEEG